MIYGISRRIIAMVATGLLILALLAFGLRQCQSNKRLKTENRVAEGQQGAAVESGAEAIATASRVATSDDATDAQVAAAQAEIAAAAKGQKGVAAKRAACRFKAYRDTPQCKEPGQ